MSVSTPGPGALRALRLPDGDSLRYGGVWLERPPASIESRSEPVFVLRAQDELSGALLREYRELAEEADCSPEFLNEIRKLEEAFDAWQREHEDRVQFPG